MPLEADPFLAIHPKDDMYDSPAKAYYYLYGSQAIELIERYGDLDRVTGRPYSILDYPCGFGRVMRHVRRRYPNARIVGADLNAAGVGFCEATFQSIPVMATENPADFQLGELFDLIFCGSLFTHFREELWDSLLDMFARHMLIPGRLIFTTTGRHSARWLEQDPTALYTTAEVGKAVLADYEATGFGYRDYQEGCGYGVAVSHPSWVINKFTRMPGWKLVYASEKAWGQNQDVYVLERVHE